MEKEINYSGFKNAAEYFLRHLFQALYPRHIGNYEKNLSETDKYGREILSARKYLAYALDYVCGGMPGANPAKAVLESFFSRIPYVKSLVQTDIQAAYEGDPAAKSYDEVILAYPAFFAIAAYRFAHELYLLKVPVLPRLITECAHSKTGIDIHPGATIGPYFFIDHGTGVVIGETTIIGQHVKLYQQVTLGAKSFELGPDGKPVKGIKRHPEIGDYAVIYAGATILGGDTKIGHHCIIGGNVWLTHS
ncbi:MAG: serine acetyltransferase, partial [Elusimicrobiales bacterium]|nr:serine acetyltransferase [Elusimicrobiales bacterium]